MKNTDKLSKYSFQYLKGEKNLSQQHLWCKENCKCIFQPKIFKQIRDDWIIPIIKADRRRTDAHQSQRNDGAGVSKQAQTGLDKDKPLTLLPSRTGTVELALLTTETSADLSSWV